LIDDNNFIFILKGYYMKNVNRIGKAISACVSIMVLTGCSMTGVNNVSIEDRSTQGNIPQVVTQQSPDVEVNAFNLKPSFKASNNNGEAIDSELSRQTKAPEVATLVQKPATVALLNTANYQTESGKLRSAQNSLQRALRISPNDPEVYLSLGEVHRRLGEYIQAEQMILKGISVAAGQSTKLRTLWSKLAKIRSESGDSAGANEAFQKSQSY
jgi:predicted Zn-dependent protease